MPDSQTHEDTPLFLFSYLLGADGQGTALDAAAVTRLSPPPPGPFPSRPTSTRAGS